MFQGEGGNQGARQALEAVFEGMGLANPSEAQVQEGGGDEVEQVGEGGENGGDGEQGEEERDQEEEEYYEEVPDERG